MSDVGDYTVLIEEVNDSKIKGLVLNFSSCYPGATYPNSRIPLIEREKFDLSDPDIAEWEITIHEATAEEKSYESMALRKQKDFLVTMVDVKYLNTYQSLQFDIIDVVDGNEIEGPGVYCEMHIQNIVGLDTNSDIKNPYVVECNAYANTCLQMNELYEHYGSCEGVVAPDTNITYKLTRETSDHVTLLSSVSVPYSIVKTKGLDIFPITLSEDMRQKIENTMTFMSLHEA